MKPKLVIDVDIQEEGKRAENMMNQIKEIIDHHKGADLDTETFYSIVKKIEEKQQYFSDYNFPPMFILITMYGVAFIDKKPQQVQLAQRAIMSPKYRLTEEQKNKKSIL